MSDGQRGPEVTQEVPFVESESIDSFECHKVQALLHPELHHRLMRVQSELRQRDLVGFLMGDLGRQMNVKAGLAKDPLRANVQELRDLAHTPVVLVVGPDLDRLSIPDEIKNLEANVHYVVPFSGPNTNDRWVAFGVLGADHVLNLKAFPAELKAVQDNISSGLALPSYFFQSEFGPRVNESTPVEWRSAGTGFTIDAYPNWGMGFSMGGYRTEFEELWAARRAEHLQG